MSSYQTPDRLTKGLLGAGSAVRIAYGAGALLAPRRMSDARLAPLIGGEPEPRLLLRAFGGHQVLVGALTVLSLGGRGPARLSAALSLSVDALDVAAALLEWRQRGRADRAVVGGILLSGAGVANFALALRALFR